MIETMFALASPEHGGRRFRRERVQICGTMRGDQASTTSHRHDEPSRAGGLVIRNAPFVSRGEQVEIVIDDGDTSYRFRAEGVWQRDDGDDYRVGLALVGARSSTPAIGEHRADLVDRIALAAAA